MTGLPEPASIIPHRPPFLFLDELVEVEPGVSAKGRWRLTGDEEFFAGHFPGRPTLPGVLMVEAIAQLGAVAVLQDPRFAGKLPLFGGIDSARFRRQVGPGDVLDLATLAYAYSSDNPRRKNVGIVMALVTGITLVDLATAQTLTARNARGARGQPRHYSDRSGWPEIRSLSAISSSVVALPSRCSAGQVRRISKNASSPTVRRSACSVIAPLM